MITMQIYYNEVRLTGLNTRQQDKFRSNIAMDFFDLDYPVQIRLDKSRVKLFYFAYPETHSVEIYNYLFL